MKPGNLASEPLGAGAILDRRMALLLLMALFGFVIIRNAWVGDDAYITARTIENFLSGYGLTHNIAVWVQTYTHPLWMFLLSGVYFLINRALGIYFWAEFYYLNVFISIAISILVSYNSGSENE